MKDNFEKYQDRQMKNIEAQSVRNNERTQELEKLSLKLEKEREEVAQVKDELQREYGRIRNQNRITNSTTNLKVCVGFYSHSFVHAGCFSVVTYGGSDACAAVVVVFTKVCRYCACVLCGDATARLLRRRHTTVCVV